MKSRTWFLLMLVLISLLLGCSTSRITVEKPDGTRITGFNSRFIWTTEGFALHARGTNEFELVLQRSNSDAQTAGAIAEGVAKGVVSGGK